jgi:hypothetical protein
LTLMPHEPTERRMRASESEIEEILRSPTTARAPTAVLIDLLSALDDRRRCREKLMLGTHTEHALTAVKSSR